jgi:hypothetical protein
MAEPISVANSESLRLAGMQHGRLGHERKISVMKLIVLAARLGDYRTPD